MTWIMVMGLALVVFLIAAFPLRAPSNGWTAIGAALLLGLAGYGLQASPGLPGAPKDQPTPDARDGTMMVEARKRFFPDMGPGQRYMIIADAFARRGRYGDAANVLRSAVEQDPRNAEAWVAMGNALVGHAEGNVSPAALHAYERAEQAAPTNAAPEFFLGAIKIRNGDLVEASKLWNAGLAKAPPDAPWRGDLAQRVAALDMLMRQIAGQAPQP